MTPETREDLLDALFDLKHDLGKYIQWPVGMLPDDASDADLRNALKSALFFTRKKGTEAVSAREIFAAFEKEWGEVAGEFRAYGDLKQAVEAALGLEALLEAKGTNIEKESCLKTLRRVGQEAAKLINEVEDNGS